MPALSTSIASLPSLSVNPVLKANLGESSSRWMILYPMLMI